jgi:hypothetical protein
MFERKFEFTAHHPLEVCEERILDIEKLGCLTELFQPTTVVVIPYELGSITEFYIRKKLGKSAGQVEVNGIIEVIGENQCAIYGSSQVGGIGILLIVFTLVSISLLIMGMYDQMLCIGLVFVWTMLACLPFIQLRNRLINTLETTLTQPKKKQV